MVEGRLERADGVDKNVCKMINLSENNGKWRAKSVEYKVQNRRVKRRVYINKRKRNEDLGKKK